jgi:hypothetical protein
VITSELLEAHLACPTKCYLRSIGEVGSGNAYAAWEKARGESYRREGIGRLAAGSSQDLACGRIEASRLKKARWQLALDQVFKRAFMPFSNSRCAESRKLLSSLRSGLFVQINFRTQTD